MRATGGKVKAVFWHLGVRRALEERGFRFTVGFGQEAPPTPGEIGMMVGSSAGCMFSLLTATGCDVPDILNAFRGHPSRLPAIDSSVIFRQRGITWKGYFRRIRNAVNLRAGEELFPGTPLFPSQPSDEDETQSGVETPRQLPFRKFIHHFRMRDLLAVRARYVLTGLEDFLEKLLGGHTNFAELRARLFFITTDLDNARVVVFSAEESDHLWYRYVSGVPLARAATCSMAAPSVFNPVSVKLEGRRHYFIDGDVYNPNETMIETDHGCDLAIVSSFEAPYRFHPAIGSLHHLGLPYEISQAIALSIYSRFLQSRNSDKSKGAALAAMRETLAMYLGEEALEKETKRLAGILEIGHGMKTLYLHPHKNPLLFFGNPFDLSPRTFGKMLLEAYLQASELLDREGFTK